VNSYTTDRQFGPSVASDGDGNFVVVWVSDGGAHDIGFGIFGQRYDSAGVALGSQFHVNSYTADKQWGPSVASDVNGNFVVVWESRQDDEGSEIYGQRYDSGGGALGSEFRVNSYTNDYQTTPSVASDASGNFVVVWVSNDQDGYGYGVFGQRYDSGGVAQGGEFPVNSYTTGYQGLPSVASDASGNFVVTWNSYDYYGISFGIFGQRYDSAGVAQGAEFRANSYTTITRRPPSVASDASGNFVVAWTSNGQDGSSYGIFGQRYDSAGVAQGGEFQINSFTTKGQLAPSVGATGTNQFVVA